MTTHLISDATTWPAIRRDPERLEEVLGFLRDNGIDADTVPIDATVTVESTNPEGDRVIRHEVYLRNANGRPYPADPNDGSKGAAREARTTPLTVPPPAHWWGESASAATP